jgi:hypothetical protein
MVRNNLTKIIQFEIILFLLFRLKNKAEIFHGLKYHFASDGPNHSLIINKLHPDDEGKYTCKINESETFAYLNVEAAKPIFEFTKKLPEKLETFRTKGLLLDCFVNHPECVPVWYRNGVVIKTDDKRYRITNEKTSGRCMLKVVKVVREDACEFACEIQGKNGPERTVCTVTVEEPEFRFIKRLPPQSETQEYAQIELECEIEDPDAICEWYFDGKKIEATPDKYEIIEDGTKRKLIIKNINPFKDPGRYECKCGFNVTGTQLFVREALKFTKELADIEGVEESEFEFVVSLNKEDARLKWFKANRQIIPGEHKFEKYSIIQSGKEHKLIIKGLELKDAGDFEARIDFVSSKCKFTVKECKHHFFIFLLFIFNQLFCSKQR